MKPQNLHLVFERFRNPIETAGVDARDGNLKRTLHTIKSLLTRWGEAFLTALDPVERKIIVWFVATRLVSFTGAAMGRLLSPEREVWDYVVTPYLWYPPYSMAAWDSYFYLQIASEGYSVDAISIATQPLHNYAFFPLYPALIRVVELAQVNPVWSGFLLSNLFALLACLVLYRFINYEYDADVAGFSVIALLLFPVSFILSAVMSEALFLFTTVAALRCAQKERWLLAGLLGMCSALTRSVGLLIVAPLAWQLLVTGVKATDRSLTWRIGARKLPLLYVGLVPLGLVLFGTYVYSMTGDPFAVANVQQDWGRERIGFDDVVQYLSGDKGFKGALYAWGLIPVLALIVSGWRKLSFGLWLWTLLMLVIPLSNSSLPGHLASMPRFLAVMFPLFILVAFSVKNWGFKTRLSVTVVSLAMLAFLSGTWNIYRSFVV